ncbi:MAG: hypothetical protein WBZ54_04925, partial [Methylocella sp.]
IGAQLGRLKVNAETLTSHLRTHRHRVASILGTAAPNFMCVNPRGRILELARVRGHGTACRIAPPEFLGESSPDVR